MKKRKGDNVKFVYIAELDSVFELKRFTTYNITVETDEVVGFFSFKKPVLECDGLIILE